MFEGIDEKNLGAAIEAMLFVSSEAVSVKALANMLDTNEYEVKSELYSLQAELNAAGRGIQLREVAGGWRLFTNPEFHSLIEAYVLSWDTRKLSAAAMETLAIVAYTQPCTRAQVASVRGVNSSGPINSLVEKGLVREMGQSEAPGNPTLYGTTRAFLEKFGLRSTEDLPDIAQYAPDEKTRKLIEQRLSASTENAVVPVDEIAQAASDALGVVDKIDFDNLTFQTDDE